MACKWERLQNILVLQDNPSSGTASLIPSKYNGNSNSDKKCVSVHTQEFITIRVCNSCMVSSTPTHLGVVLSAKHVPSFSSLDITLQDCVISGNFLSVTSQQMITTHRTGPPRKVKIKIHLKASWGPFLDKVWGPRGSISFLGCIFTLFLFLSLFIALSGLYE